MGKTRKKVYKNKLDAYLRGVNKYMTENGVFWNVEIKQHGTKEDCVWVIVG